MNVTEVVQLQDNNQHYLEVFYQKQYVLLVKELVKHMKKHVLNVSGKKVQKVVKDVEVKIPEGVVTGSRLRLPKYGEPSTTGEKMAIFILNLEYKVMIFMKE